MKAYQGLCLSLPVTTELQSEKKCISRHLHPTMSQTACASKQSDQSSIDVLWIDAGAQTALSIRWKHMSEGTLIRGGFRMGRGSVKPLLPPTPTSKFWINLINLEYRIYPKYSHPCSLPYTFFNVHFTACECA